MYLVVTRSHPPCGYCTAAKTLLTSKGLEFREVDLEEVLGAFRALGLRTVPAIFDGDMDKASFVGGYDQLKAKLS